MTHTSWSPQIARTMHELSNAAPAAPAATSLRSYRPSRSREPRMVVTLVAAAIAATAVVGLVLAVDRPSPSEPTRSPRPTVDVSINNGVLLPDLTNSGVTLISDETYGALGESRGAVLAPDYTVFGFVVSRPGNGDPDPNAQTRIVNGYGVKAIADGSAPSEIYRTITSSCATLTVTTAGEAAWSDGTLALLGGTTLDGSSVAVRLPAGWIDLGASRAQPQHIMELSVVSNGQAVQLSLQQMAGVPAGWFLSTFETAPRAVDLNGATAWIVNGATTPEYHSIIGERDGIAFALSGMLSTEALTNIAQSFRTTNDTTARPGDAVLIEPAGTNTLDCQSTPTLKVTPFVEVVPDGQQDILSDGEVSLAEYQAAFDRFRTCAKDRGGSVVLESANSATGEIAYTTGGELLAIGQTGGSAENECYQEYFAQTELVFSSSNGQVLSNLAVEQLAFFNKTIRPCLESVGVEIPDDLVVASPDWIRLLDANTAAHRAGNCGGIPTDTTSP